MSGTLEKPRAKVDVYESVTGKIVAALESGVRPWCKPWNAEHAAGRICRPLRSTGERYQGINVLMLWSAAEEHGYDSPYWVTFKQALELGGNVMKGEHGSPVVYASTFNKTTEGADGEEIESQIPFLKQYTVFNASQCEGLPEKYYATAKPPADTIPERIELADRFFAGLGADIREGGTQAYYTITDDYVRMPKFETFKDAESHASTLAHEMTHWTRHESRLNREFGRKRWGDEGYAMEELVAELGAAYLCADLAITSDVREDHAAYIGNWLTVLKNDKRAIFTAASHASKAVTFMHEKQPKA